MNNIKASLASHATNNTMIMSRRLKDFEGESERQSDWREAIRLRVNYLFVQTSLLSHRFSGLLLKLIM